MLNFVPLSQLGPANHLMAAEAVPKKTVCMFCQLQMRDEGAYEQHLSAIHPGWAMVLLQKMGMKIARENG